jgi:hypothetical protein
VTRWAYWTAILLSLHCSVLYAPPNARQCASDADCEDQPQLQGLACDAEHGVCVSKQANLVGGCESTTECTEQNEGRAALCRFPGSPCVNIATADCPQVSGDWHAADVLLLGSVGAHTFKLADGSARPVDYVERLSNAVDLGLEEWQREVPGGLFFSQRPIAMVHCNSNGEPAVAQRAMDHLLNDLRVPVVLALSDIEQDAIAQQAIDADVTLVCVECQAPAALPPQLERGLVWRMLPPFENQASLAAWRVSDLEQRIRLERGLADGAPLRLAAWSDHGEAFDAFLQKFHEVVRFNGVQSPARDGSSYFEQRNVDARYESQDQLKAARSMVEFMPDILVVAMNEDFTSYYLRFLEAQWPPTVPKPHYVLTLLNQEIDLLRPIVTQDDDLRLRLSGTGLSVDEEVAGNRAGFRARYRNRFGQDPGRTETGYDAMYATALAIYSADADGRLDGASIAAHFARLREGAIADVDPGALAAAQVYLSAQKSVDLVGSSSRLDWNPITHRVESDLGLWCVSRDAQGALLLESDTGPRWTPEGTTGAYECPGEK